MKFFTGFLVILGVMALMFWGTHTSIVSKDENVNEKFGVVQTDLQRRADLIPNLVEVVKGYAAHEKEVFAEVTKARSSVGSLVQVSASELAESPELQQQLLAAQQQMSGALGRLIAVAEAYPDLKASQNFRDLQVQLEGTENRIKTSRRDAQIAVADYNKAVRTFPGVLIARMFGFEKKAFFMATDGAEKAPQITFTTE